MSLLAASCHGRGALGARRGPPETASHSWTVDPCSVLRLSWPRIKSCVMGVLREFPESRMSQADITREKVLGDEKWYCEEMGHNHERPSSLVSGQLTREVTEITNPSHKSAFTLISINHTDLK
ncbi:hypothetical protein RRG08_034431 [Elysia crispata]|uniref:Uncharacterized protein n=1 Tax=Elysia crispata TaxID=231223 RepID=A0AAE0YDI8_9GAST|nr:hypothetical protein RRG08_034431 [Elysia crispata]